MRLIDRIGNLLDRLHKPAVTLPIKRTWGDWAKGLAKAGLREWLLAMLHFAEWLVK